MREIIHIQAGSLSNYTGTHYWNTQENYFDYDEDDISITDHNISFKEGRDEHVRPVYYLRQPVPVVRHLHPIYRIGLLCVRGSLLLIRNVRVVFARRVEASAHAPCLCKANFGTLTRYSDQEESLTLPTTW